MKVKDISAETIVRTTTTNNFHLQKPGVSEPTATCSSRFEVTSGWSNDWEFQSYFACPRCEKKHGVVR